MPAPGERRRVVAATVSWDQLRDLAGFRARKGCAISIFLNLDPAPIYADYCKDWMRAFLQLAMDNVGYEGGREITAEQNEMLGAILRAVPA